MLTKDVEGAMRTLGQAVVDVSLGSYAHSWHCNIAMMCYDAILDHATKITDGSLHEHAHKIGNDAASRFMKLCFGVDTKNGEDD